MANEMTVLTEVWPVAADAHRIWLLDGHGPWLSDPVMSDQPVHNEVEYSLAVNNAANVAMVHSTSWRVDGQSVRLTYLAVVDLGGRFALDCWPHAQPVTAQLATKVGRPIPHLPTEAPTPREIDVLYHGLRHLAYLALHDDEAAATFNILGYWHEHLADLAPTLAGMYRSVVAEAEAIAADGNA